jgi:hypothetical protein
MIYRRQRPTETRLPDKERAREFIIETFREVNKKE